MGLRLALAMVALQGSIGALNDLVDAPLDSGRKPGKPIPHGAATGRDAVVLVGVGSITGLILVAPSGPLAVVVAGVGLACGYAYDLWLSRGPWSWLPLAIALPLVPIYAWVGATGDVPFALVALIPVGVLAGAGLAIANGIADVERDAGAGTASIAVHLGRGRAWSVHAALLVGAIAAAGILLAGPARSASGGIPTGPLGAMLAGAALILAGIAISRTGGARRREWAWELEALGVAVLGAGWVAAAA